MTTAGRWLRPARVSHSGRHDGSRGVARVCQWRAVGPPRHIGPGRAGGRSGRCPRLEVSADSPLAFQGTADDARSLLVTISGTVVTTIALVLGLTVVALQLSSTQFSPRLLRNFLRDRPNQIVLSIFVATFAYSAAGLYTVGVSSGARVEEYPRLAVSGAVVLLFVSLAAVVFFADHSRTRFRSTRSPSESSKARSPWCARVRVRSS